MRFELGKARNTLAKVKALLFECVSPSTAVRQHYIPCHTAYLATLPHWIGQRGWPVQIADVVAQLENAGAVLAVEGDRVKLRAPAGQEPSAEVVAQLRREKQALLDYLRLRQTSQRSVAVRQGPIGCQTAKPESPTTPTAREIPAGAVLLALQCDGVGHPLDGVPKCWCCQTPWRLQRLQQSQRKTYAWLEPACGCLDAPQCLTETGTFCGFCVQHCRCGRGK